MYHETVISRRLAKLADSIRATIDPKFAFHDTPKDEVQEWCDHLETLFDAESLTLRRPLHSEEEAFIRHELARSKADFPYWMTRYAKIKTKKMSLEAITPTAVQTLMMGKIADAEMEAIQGKTGDGIVFMVLKARQLGISTLSEIIIAHRSFFYGNTTALIAADVEQRTENLYEMLVRVYENLPWWMKPRSSDPKKDFRVKNRQLYFADQDSTIRVGSSANMQGGDSGQDRGSIGTGMTLPLVHLSELALWANPYQIDDALMPSIPMSSRTFAIFESTAKGRGNWWHEKWFAAKRGLGRRRPVFIPWYTDPKTYTLPAPSNWVPSEVALHHANRVKDTSFRWCGKTVILSRDQLFWWERTRAEYIAGKELSKFLAEYCADDEEAFQNTTVGPFPTELLNELRQRLTNPTYVDISPKMPLHATD